MKPKEIAGIVIIASLFFAGVFLAREFSAQIGTYLDFGLAGMFVYVFAGIFATVAAPISTVPIIPIAAALWGPFTTAVLSVFAWTIGSIIAFLIARYFGKPIIARFADVESISKYERLLGGGVFILECCISSRGGAGGYFKLCDRAFYENEYWRVYSGDFHRHHSVRNCFLVCFARANLTSNFIWLSCGHRDVYRLPKD